MFLNASPFSEASRSPIALPAEFDTPNQIYCVSNVLRQRIASEGIDAAQLNEEFEGFEAICTEIDARFVVPLDAAYHNADHARAVAARFKAYLEASGASPVVQKLGFIAGLFHDAFHPGERYREDASGVEHRELTNEEVAATACVEFLNDTLNTAQLMWLYGAIMATSFGQRTGGDPVVNEILARRPHLVRPYAPVTSEQWLLHLADINSTGGKNGFEEFMAGGISLAQEVSKKTKLEWGAAERLTYAKSQAGFLGYIGIVTERARPFLNNAEFTEGLLREQREARERINTLLSVWTTESLLARIA